MSNEPSDQPIVVTQAEAEAHAIEFLVEQDLAGEIDLEAEGDQATVVVMVLPEEPE